MTPISEIHTNRIQPNHGMAPHTNGKHISRWDTFIKTAKNYAKIIDSRESTYRLALDLSAFDIPTLGAAAFRNFWNFLEALWEASIGTIMVFAAPKITSFVGKLLGKLILPKEEQKNTEHYLRFQMRELTDSNSIRQGIERIKEEEPKDQQRIRALYEDLENKEKQAMHYSKKANEIRRFCDDFKDRVTDEIREKIYALKRATILGESFIEGGVWGSFGLTLRWFRKNIIKKERFTGTMSYLSDPDSSRLGEGGDLTLFQKIGGTFAIFLSPIINAVLLYKTKDRNAVKKNRLLSMVDSHLDMTHGVYPKLGLLFSYTSVPKWTGLFITSQGWYERIERIIKFFTILPSWWLGHRITNGRLALSGDKYLSEKYNAEPGILIEPNCVKEQNTPFGDWLDRLKYLCPEPARIHQVLDRTEGNENLRKEATDLHAKTLYKGFALHSFLVWVVTMLVNWSTKLRVKHALGVAS